MDRALIKIRQGWVLHHPCRTVQECGAPGYRVDFSLRGQQVATVLTIDLFSAPIAWHAQVAWLDAEGKTRPLCSYSWDEQTGALALAQELLAGIGEARLIPESNEWCIGLAKPLTDAERTITLARGAMNAPHRQTARAEFNQYDFRNKQTQVGDGLYVPEERTLIHG